MHDEQRVAYLLQERTCLPAAMVQRGQISIWSILKQSVGKDLSRVTVPVIFNEPLSFLQRLVEYMEYFDTLKDAAKEPDALKRMELVAAFAVSSLASNWNRVAKPFNPLLGETYELDRMHDLGFRIVCEQVSHHPPISAFFAEGHNFKFYGSVFPKLRFWGRSIEIQPKGVLTLELSKYNDVYTWNNINCSVHNLVVGTPFIEQHGTMEIVSHSSKLTCNLNFKASGAWLKSDSGGHHIEGFITDESGHRLKALYGVWTNFLAAVDVRTFERHFPSWGRERKARSSGATDAIRRTPSAPPPPEDGRESPGLPQELSLPMPVNLPILAGSTVLWRVRARPDGSEQYYNFTSFALLLNEPLTGEERFNISPSDSRLRPDIRLLEGGDLDGAATAKNRLEEKQRDSQAKRKKSRDDWQPLWFRCKKHPMLGEECWQFTNQYWSRDWSSSPDIF